MKTFFRLLYLHVFLMPLDGYVSCRSRVSPGKITLQQFAALFLLTLTLACAPGDLEVKAQKVAQQETSSVADQEAIIEEAFANDVYATEGIFSTEWQEVLDAALEKDPTIAPLWQQKAMPLYKQGKYELGRPFLDKAVQYDRDQYQEYRAFMTCIFAKDYKDAILDFEDCIDRYGDNYVMDHSYSFYIAISKIQLNEFEEAEQLLRSELARQEKEKGADWVHHLDCFYLGISLYEQNKFEEAEKAFEKAITIYPKFADAQVYRSKALRKLGKTEMADELGVLAKENGKAGYSINEDNAIYERYPYQIRWHLW